MYKYSHKTARVDSKNVEVFKIYDYEGDELASEYTIEVLSADSKKTLEALKYLTNALEKREEQLAEELEKKFAS